MSAGDRNSAVLEFTDNPRCNVILVSLKAGNAGLNLTAANHVVMLDPFWNPFVEYQAADRCYRIGQTRDVTVHRVLISDEGFEKKVPGQGATVEDRILALQEKKRELVETALDESAGSSLARLGVRELGYLFGVNGL
jgi:SNF2 family DNA or RNA helicase